MVRSVHFFNFWYFHKTVQNSILDTHKFSCADSLQPGSCAEIQWQVVALLVLTIDEFWLKVCTLYNVSTVLAFWCTENGWPGFDVSITEPVESIWERTGTGNVQHGTGGNPWTSYPLTSNQQPAKTSPGPASSSNFWNQPPATWSTGPTYNIWGGENVSTDQRPSTDNTAELAEDGVADGTAIFDPFNSLEMSRSIWNPNSTSGSSGMSGWTFSSAGPRSDN